MASPMLEGEGDSQKIRKMAVNILDKQWRIAEIDDSPVGS
jgi:hypothetical protein